MRLESLLEKTELHKGFKFPCNITELSKREKDFSNVMLLLTDKYKMEALKKETRKR